ncbi:MAG: cobyric acid synthase [Planctomycetes bacterium]|nr:cobyric acid synthase [Planctomycetota bacterium]
MTNPHAKTIMVMGTSSSAGKSLLTAALCRCFSNRGVRVAPFKAQNMSNNAAVCGDGSEIGRSQAMQAIAARTLPLSEMNPILLKPEGNTHSQVLVDGRPMAHRKSSVTARDYFSRKRELWPHVTQALDRLRERFDLVVIEGAGSPAELNLMDVEIVNMSVARYAKSPVLLVGDIERGGIFAQLLGTLWLLPESDRQLIRGLIVNKFRGDVSLFDRGNAILEEKGGVPVLGVLPWIDQLRLPEEDAVALWERRQSAGEPKRTGDIDIAILHLPHIANFDDFDPLENTEGVTVRYVQYSEQLGAPDILIIPGTKNTIADLDWMKRSGLARAVIELAKSKKTQIVGICGGYQILGRSIYNPDSLESRELHVEGLGLLDVETIFHPNKQTCQVEATVLNDSIADHCTGMRISGYEIHIGETTTNSPWLKRTSTQGYTHSRKELDGAVSSDGWVWGCYIHGLFANECFRVNWLYRQHSRSITKGNASGNSDPLDDSLNLLAKHFEQHIDFGHIEKIVWDSL